MTERHSNTRCFSSTQPLTSTMHCAMQQPSPHVSSILVTCYSKMVMWLLGKGHFSFFLPFYFKLNSLLKSPGGERELLKHRAPYWGMTSSIECAESSSVLELHQGHAAFLQGNLFPSPLFTFTFQMT